MGIFARGRALYTELFQDIQDAKMRDLAIESHTFAVHFREFNNLSIQESRLRRNYAKDLAELNALQAKRRQAARPQVRTMNVTLLPGSDDKTEAAAPGASNGFVFANAPNTVGSAEQPLGENAPATPARHSS
jgi:hypothetical protein